MNRSLKTAVGGLAVASVLVVGFDYATYAATGQSMIIGQLNTGDNVTKVRRTTAGPAMEFQTTDGSAPFAVQRNTRVVKLNADYVDGRHATDLENPAYTYTTATSGGTSITSFSIPQVPEGNYLLTYSTDPRPNVRNWHVPGTGLFPIRKPAPDLL